jgi:transposase
MERRDGQSFCVIQLEPLRGISRHCSGCGESCAAIHDLEQRRIRDLPVFEYRVELIVPRVRVACPHSAGRGSSGCRALSPTHG